jgi:hypothetical protein
MDWKSGFCRKPEAKGWGDTWGGQTGQIDQRETLGIPNQATCIVGSE